MGQDHAKNDFSVRKQKIGKKRLLPSNETKINLKIAKLDSVRNVDLNVESVPNTAKETSLKEFLLHSKNHNVNMRRDSLVSLTSFVNSHPDFIRLNAHSIFSVIFERLLDPEFSVRGALLSLVPSVLSCFDENSLAPHLGTISLFIRSALSKLNTSIRLDALSMILVMMQSNSKIISPLLISLLDSVESLVDPSAHSMVCSSYLSSCMPSIYGVGAVNGKQNPAGNLFASRITSLDARFCCVYVLYCILTGVSDPEDGVVSSHAFDDEEHVPAALDRNRLLSLSFLDSLKPELLQPLSARARGALSVDSAARLSAHIMQLWLELEPREKGTFSTSAHSLQKLALLVRVLTAVLASSPLGVPAGPSSLEAFSPQTLEELFTHRQKSTDSPLSQALKQLSSLGQARDQTDAVSAEARALLTRCVRVIALNRFPIPLCVDAAPLPRQSLLKSHSHSLGSITEQGSLSSATQALNEALLQLALRLLPCAAAARNTHAYLVYARAHVRGRRPDLERALAAVDVDGHEDARARDREELKRAYNAFAILAPSKNPSVPPSSPMTPKSVPKKDTKKSVAGEEENDWTVFFASVQRQLHTMEQLARFVRPLQAFIEAELDLDPSGSVLSSQVSGNSAPARKPSGAVTAGLGRILAYSTLPLVSGEEGAKAAPQLLQKALSAPGRPDTAATAPAHAGLSATRAHALRIALQELAAALPPPHKPQALEGFSHSWMTPSQACQLLVQLPRLLYALLAADARPGLSERIVHVLSLYARAHASSSASGLRSPFAAALKEVARTLTPVFFLVRASSTLASSSVSVSSSASLLEPGSPGRHVMISGKSASFGPVVRASLELQLQLGSLLGLLAQCGPGTISPALARGLDALFRHSFTLRAEGGANEGLAHALKSVVASQQLMARADAASAFTNGAEALSLLLGAVMGCSVQLGDPLSSGVPCFRFLNPEDVDRPELGASKSQVEDNLSTNSSTNTNTLVDPLLLDSLGSDKVFTRTLSAAACAIQEILITAPMLAVSLAGSLKGLLSDNSCGPLRAVIPALSSAISALNSIPPSTTPFGAVEAETVTLEELFGVPCRRATALVLVLVDAVRTATPALLAVGPHDAQLLHSFQEDLQALAAVRNSLLLSTLLSRGSPFTNGSYKDEVIENRISVHIPDGSQDPFARMVAGEQATREGETLARFGISPVFSTESVAAVMCTSSSSDTPTLLSLLLDAPASPFLVGEAPRMQGLPNSGASEFPVLAGLLKVLVKAASAPDAVNTVGSLFKYSMPFLRSLIKMLKIRLNVAYNEDRCLLLALAEELKQQLSLLVGSLQKYSTSSTWLSSELSVLLDSVLSTILIATESL